MGHKKNSPRQHVQLKSEHACLSLHEMSRACEAQVEWIVELVAEGVLIPEGRQPEYWQFSEVRVRHAAITQHLQRDLGVNLAGVALALQLLEELAVLQKQLDKFRHEDMA
jgi:chaperone modulatory protein CbpM